MSPADIPLHVELLAALRRRGAPAREIEAFRRHLATLQPDAALPCPFCFVNRRKGVLAPPPPRGGGEFRCDTCGERLAAV